MSREILFIGANGFVGTKTVEIMRTNNVLVLTPDQNKLDITNPQQVETAIATTPASAIILAAAYTDVDGAQTDEDLVHSVNVVGTENVAKAALGSNKFLVYISTDFVFPGTEVNPGLYSEDSPIADPNSPDIGEYAKSKILAEKLLAEIGVRHAISRIAFPFGDPSSDRDLVRKIIYGLQHSYCLFTDQSYNPTYIPDLSDALAQICDKEMEGTFHICCQPPVTPFELGEFIAEELDLNIKPKQGLFVDYMAEHTHLAPRPKNGGLRDELTNQKLKRVSPNWKQAIRQTLEEL